MNSLINPEKKVAVNLAGYEVELTYNECFAISKGDFSPIDPEIMADLKYASAARQTDLMDIVDDAYQALVGNGGTEWIDDESELAF